MARHLKEVRQPSFMLLCLFTQLPISQCFDDVMTFLNSYQLLNHDNRVAVCLCHQAGT